MVNRCNGIGYHQLGVASLITRKLKFKYARFYKKNVYLAQNHAPMFINPSEILIQYEVNLKAYFKESSKGGRIFTILFSDLLIIR